MPALGLETVENEQRRINVGPVGRTPKVVSRPLRRRPGDRFAAVAARPLSAASVAVIADFSAKDVAETPSVAANALNSIAIKRNKTQGL